ncbi:MAG: HPr(Ser) kinase/phosphatase [Bacillota bacterium]|nr:HPr(Ser) kinase/phosphatase [Bacillota bacterium]
MKKIVPIKEFAENLNLLIVQMGKRDYIEADTSDINRPAMQFSGFFEHFAASRVQLIGNLEITYLGKLPPDVLKQRMEQFFSYPIPCVILARNHTPPKAMLDAAKMYDVPILRSLLATTKIGHRTMVYLDGVLAPQITRHGVLMDVYGVGILIAGESGIGKSELALELVKRGHRLVADDVVEMKRVSDDVLIGRSPELIRHLMEIRGIGIIDVRTVYGVGAVVQEKSIEILMNMELWDNSKEYEHLGIHEEYTTLMDVRIPTVTMPVTPGRNLAIVVEVAAMNYRLKRMGYSAAEELDNKLMKIYGYTEVKNEES